MGGEKEELGWIWSQREKIEKVDEERDRLKEETKNEEGRNEEGKDEE